MLNKQRVLEELNKFADQHQIKKPDIQVLGGASLVIRGLREVAADIDLYVCKETCLRLLETGAFESRLVKEKPEIIWLTSELIDIRDTAYECDMTVEGFHIQSLKSVLGLKLRLNRDKDQADILNIQKTLNLL